MPRWKALGTEGWSKRTEGLEERWESVVFVLSSELRGQGRAFRTGDGGSVGTEVVVVIVVTVPAFCFDSVDAWRAYLRRFARFWFEVRCEDVPRPASDIAVESEPCCEKLVPSFAMILHLLHLRFEHRRAIVDWFILVID
jgi:hypothetical protein